MATTNQPWATPQHLRKDLIQAHNLVDACLHGSEDCAGVTALVASQLRISLLSTRGEIERGLAFLLALETRQTSHQRYWLEPMNREQFDAYTNEANQKWDDIKQGQQDRFEEAAKGNGE